MWKYTREHLLFGTGVETLSRSGPSMPLNQFLDYLFADLSSDLQWGAAKWAWFVSLLTIAVAGCLWICVLWWWYSPLGLLYIEIPRPLPPFVTSNWLLPLTCSPIERKRLLYLTVKTHLYVPLCIRAICHICSVAFETNEVLSSPLMSSGRQLPRVVDGFEAKHITRAMFVVYGGKVMQKKFF